MTATHTYPITKEGWIRAWLDNYADDPHWRFGFDGYVLVGALPEVDETWGPWMVEWDPRPGVLIVDGRHVASPEWL